MCPFDHHLVVSLGPLSGSVPWTNVCVCPFDYHLVVSLGLFLVVFLGPVSVCPLEHHLVVSLGLFPGCVPWTGVPWIIVGWYVLGHCLVVSIEPSFGGVLWKIVWLCLFQKQR